MLFGKVARAYDAHRARFEGRALAEGAIDTAVSLLRTVGLMVEQGEAEAGWAVWARAWCLFVGLLVAPGLGGLSLVELATFLRAVYERAQAHQTRRDAVDAVRVTRMWAGAGATRLPSRFRSVAERVIESWAELVELGIASGGCAWCDVPQGDAGPAAPSAAGAPAVEVPEGRPRWEAQTWVAFDAAGEKHRVLLEVWQGSRGDGRARVFRSPGEEERGRWDSDPRRLVAALLGRPMPAGDVLVSLVLDRHHGPVESGGNAGEPEAGG